MLKKYICTLFLVFLFSACISQTFDEKKLKHFTTKDGLSNNRITGIEQDSTGYIWISTSRGLNRFDGSTFKQFLHNENENSLPDNSIFSIRLLKNHQLAVATDDGAQIISTKTLKVKNLAIPTDEALRYWSNACKYISSDRENNYGVSTKTGFYIFSPEGKLKKRYDHFTAKDIGQAWMMFGNHLFELPDGNLMQENSSSLFIYHRDKNQIEDASNQFPAMKPFIEALQISRKMFEFTSAYKLVVFNIEKNSLDLVDIRNGSSLSFPANIDLQKEIGWQSKLTRIDGRLWAVNSKTKGFYFLTIDTVSGVVSQLSQKHFGDHFCSLVFSDKQKRLWIGTDEGLFMENAKQETIEMFPVSSSNPIDQFAVTSIWSQDNRLFAGTDKNEIIVIDKVTGRMIDIIRFSNNPEPDVVTFFLLIHPDTLWVASTNNLYWVNVKNLSYGKAFKGDFFSNYNKPAKFFLDKKRTVWIGTYKINTIYTYDLEQRKLDSLTRGSNPLLNINIITSFAEDLQGNIWMGGDAIARWNATSRKIDSLVERLPTQNNRKKGYTVMSDSKGDLWCTVNDDGFANLSSRVPMHLRPTNLVPENVSQVFPTMIKDKILMSTTNGIGFFDTRRQKGIIFQDENIPPTITSYNFYYDGSDESVWIGGKNMISRIPFSDKEGDAEPPVLSFSEVSVINDSTINYPPEEIFLKHFQNDIKIGVSAINFIDPQNMRFAYRFKYKKDTSWIDMGTQQNILLTNISPGNYLLEVKVYSYDNKWPDQTKKLLINIKPPFWKTVWFYVAIGILVAAAIYFLYNYRIKGINQKANIDKQLAETEMKALHSQMNPHFIFNCLNSIREMILNNETEQASLYLSKFARLIRITLNHSSKPFVSLEDTIDYLQRYLEMEQIRKSNFSYKIDVDEKLHPNEVLLPPMLIQPFIENAIWHGASPGKQIHLIIQFKTEHNKLICIVDDDGIGINSSLKNKEPQLNYQSVGISNIKQRIHVLNEKYNLQSTIDIEDKSTFSANGKTGTIVTLHLPIKTNESLP